jgi:WD40 repeat protein/transcriptional regulator with XRE-family HTH domain
VWDADKAAESFRGLLLRHRGRTELTQRGLAARARVSLRSVQDWEGGTKFPSAGRLQGLIQALLATGGLSPDREAEEARALWAAVVRDSPRMHPPFDEEWFAGLLGVSPSPTAHLAPATRVQDWGEAPDSIGFVGRAEELMLLRRWLLEERSRAVAVLGFGGIGKTSLAAKLARDVAPSFERVYWRSLRNAPPVAEWLAGAIGFLSDQQVVPPPSEAERITALVQVLRDRRCLLVVDNSETVFEPAQRDGRYRAGIEGYGRVLQAVGETSHQICLLVTSREAPPELAVLGGGARVLELHGLGTSEAQALLADKQLNGEIQAWVSLVERYGGNGLALKIVGETIRQVYNGDIAAFLTDASASFGTVFGGIRRLLDAQAERLSPVEHEVLTRLAVAREPINLAELSSAMAPTVSRSTVVEAIETLRRKSLVERGERGATFTLQSMVLEYMTDRLVETVADEIGRGQPGVLVEQPLIRAQAKEYVRKTQERLIGAPILQRLGAEYAEAGTELRLQGLLDEWRGRPGSEQGYGPGNAVNLLRLLRGNLRNTDLSGLTLRQVYLQGVDAQDASMAGASLVGAVLDEAFAYPTAVALSADGTFLVAGTPTGDVRLWRGLERTLLLAAQGHTAMVWCVAVSGDGRLMASGGDDGTVRLWAAASGQSLATLQGHVGPVWGVSLSEDGRFVASGGVDGTVRLWDAGTGQLLTTLEGHTGGVRAVAVSGDGRLVASGGDDSLVRLWEAGSGRLLATLEGHAGVVFGVALSGDGSLVASGGIDGTVRLWESATGQLQATLQGHPGGLRGVALSGDGRLVASGGADGTLRLWDSGSGALLATLQDHTGAIWAVAVSRDGRLVASAGGNDGTVRLWESGTGQLLATLQGDTVVVSAVAVVADGRLVASGGIDGIVRLWESATGQLLASLQGHIGQVRGVALSGDGRLLASGGNDGTVRLWATGSGQLLATLEGHTGPVWCVTLSEDGQLVASGGVDETVWLWAVGNRQLVATLRGHTGMVWGVALSEKSDRLASCGLDGTVRLWEASSGQLLTTLQGHAGVVLCVALSADGRLIASGGDDGTVRLWEAESGAFLRSLRSDRHYQRLDITGLTGVTEAQRAALLDLGAFEQEPASSHTAAAAG